MESPCALSHEVFGVVHCRGFEKIVCPALKWDNGRYWCELCQDPVKGEEYRKKLAVGEGCCRPLPPDRKE